MTGDCLTGTLIESWLFAYDGDGTRTATVHYTGVTPDSTTLYYFGGAYEVTDGVAKSYYSFGGQTIMKDENGELQYFLTDHLGSMVSITNHIGSMTSQQRYLPFGGVRSDVDSITETDYGYTGQRTLDDEIGLMDYKFRFYSATLGRFISPDSITPDMTQGLNRYSYVRNNPVNFNDPTGHCVVGGHEMPDSSPACDNLDPDDNLSESKRTVKPKEELPPHAACFQGGFKSNATPNNGTDKVCKNLAGKSAIEKSYDFLASYSLLGGWVSYKTQPTIMIGYSWGGPQAYSEARYHSDWNIDILILIDPVWMERGDNYGQIELNPFSEFSLLPRPILIQTGVITKPDNVKNMIIIMSENPGSKYENYRYSASSEDALTITVPNTDHNNVDEILAQNIKDSISNFLGFP